MQEWNQVAGADANNEMDMTPSDTIQKTINATEMTSQKLRDTINSTIARYAKLMSGAGAYQEHECRERIKK